MGKLRQDHAKATHDAKVRRALLPWAEAPLLLRLPGQVEELHMFREMVAGAGRWCGERALCRTIASLRRVRRGARGVRGARAGPGQAPPPGRRRHPVAASTWQGTTGSEGEGFKVSLHSAPPHTPPLRLSGSQRRASAAAARGRSLGALVLASAYFDADPFQRMGETDSCGTRKGARAIK